MVTSSSWSLRTWPFAALTLSLCIPALGIIDDPRHHPRQLASNQGKPPFTLGPSKHHSVAHSGRGSRCARPVSDPNKINATAYRYFLGLGALVRSEASFVVEWAVHHVSEGVEMIYLVDQETVPAGSGSPRRLGPTSLALGEGAGSCFVKWRREEVHFTKRTFAL